jgi:protein gp37
VFLEIDLFRFEESQLLVIDRHIDTVEASAIASLAKRPAQMRRIITDRYGQTGFPAHIWLGVTCEDNRVKCQLGILRGTKQKVGGTAFPSIEPITAPTDEIDLTDMDWVLTGGESGRRHRPIKYRWLEDANENALSHGTPLHFKQYGHESNNPLVQRNMARGMKITAAFEKAVADGDGRGNL